MLKGQDIICISTSDWDRPWGSKQQLMSRLSAHNRVLYVEYQASFLHLYLFARFKKWNRLQKISENIFVFTPFPLLPFGYYFRNINTINQRIILASIRKIFKKIRFRNPILWIYPPSAVDLIDKLGEKLVLYHCIADFTNEKKNHLRTKTILSMEKELVKRSDIVLTLTESLRERHMHKNVNTYLFPSAVDDRLFLSFLNRDIEEPKDIRGIKKPRIGLVGYLDARIIDTELLCFLADRYPEWSVILIGPRFRYFSKFKSLTKRNNVYFLGEKENYRVPLYIKNLDVCIIPYVINEFTNNISPLKLYEYLALGKPVISTKLEEVQKFKDIIKVSDDTEDFIKNISLALKEKDVEIVNKRLDFARENSWTERLRYVSELIEKEEKYKKEIGCSDPDIR